LDATVAGVHLAPRYTTSTGATLLAGGVSEDLCRHDRKELSCLPQQAIGLSIERGI
jgi:hypothetical protein